METLNKVRLSEINNQCSSKFAAFEIFVYFFLEISGNHKHFEYKDRLVTDNLLRSAHATCYIYVLSDKWFSFGSCPNRSIRSITWYI